MIEIRIQDATFSISRDECLKLYVLLGENAPFVRHQVGIVRHGGHTVVTLKTDEERQQVRSAIASAMGSGEAIGPGLRALETALGERSSSAPPPAAARIPSQ